ncbi:MAG: GxxExxY protein [Chloroflexi bacterium]|nr:GxxExxY protein [Chloroflexota bacterium]
MARADLNGKDGQTHAIIGAAMEVHRQLGPGFLEGVYHEALAIELTERGVPFVHEHDLPVAYKGHQLACAYRADFICYDDVIVELKALREMGGIEEAQVLNYLKASGHERGLLLNFGRLSLEFKRLIFSHQPRPPVSTIG